MRDPKSYSAIVFDMGHVLCEYDSKKAIQQFTDDPAAVNEIRYTVFNSYEWCLLDAGLADEQRVKEFTLRRLSSDRLRAIASQALDTWHLHNLWPKEGMAEVVREIKARGQKLYILSNAGLRVLDIWKNIIPCADLFDGAIFSAPERCLKPQKEIYQRLFDRYSLNPADCLFIDDLPWNIQGAADCGMDGWCFTTGKVEDLRAALGL